MKSTFTFNKIPNGHWNVPAVAVPSTLDIVDEQLASGLVDAALDVLFEDLEARRVEEAPDDWKSFAQSCLQHPLCGLLHQDPFTYRAFSKPRGYAGDAVMMDYIYGLGEAHSAAANATAIGRAILQYMDSRPSAKAVRYRRRLLAGLIDRVAQRGNASVLAIAAGHLREVDLSFAVQAGQLSSYVAFDQDEASLAEVLRSYSKYGIQTIRGSVRHILAGAVNLGQHDFVYAAGLFDYLDAQVAASLTRHMWNMVRPGGMMLIPNFMVGARDRGYMESFMDWHLIYRTESEMWTLASVLPKSEIEDCHVFEDDVETITYLLVTKKS